jgi:hypothetical protein
MKRHTQTYFDLNPKPSAKGLLWQGVKALALAIYAVAFVYLLTAILFSF